VPTWFTPAKDAKLGGHRVSGVQMIVTDRSVLDAPELFLELGSALLKLYQPDLQPLMRVRQKCLIYPDH
jgi:hypothetical protein